MLKPFQTERLLLRPIEIKDAKGLFDLDSDPEVLKYIGTPPFASLNDSFKVIDILQKQYSEFGIGRWAVIERESNEFIGWCGLKYFDSPINRRSDFYELGYRFIQKYWGKGYASESVKAWLNVAFNHFKCDKVFAMTNIQHRASAKVLTKIGFEKTETFIYNDEPCVGEPIDWFEVKKN